MMTVASERAHPTVLLIDGDNKSRLYFADQLKQCFPDFVILHARSGQAGIETFQAQQIDCVILELDLPDMSGFEVLAKFVPDATQRSVAIVVLTRFVSQTLGELAKETGAQAALVKSHTSGDELATVIEKAIVAVGPRKPTR